MIHRMLTLVLTIPLFLCHAQSQKETFTLGANAFFLNGKPFRILSGELHYPRMPREYWKDRLLKARAMGLNTVCTYLFWNWHETEPGQFSFAGNLDVAGFIRIAQEVGLRVIIRPGPYICSEWDFGGLPAWLLRDPDIRVRCLDPKFMAAVRCYVKRVGRELRGLQITRGVRSYFFRWKTNMEATATTRGIWRLFETCIEKPALTFLSIPLTEEHSTFWRPET